MAANPGVFRAPWTFLSMAIRNRHLIYTLSRRQVQSTYRGSLLGSLWTWCTPVFLLAVYTFVFSFVMKARWGDLRSPDEIPFSLFIFSGLTIYGIVAEVLTRSPGLVRSNSIYLRQFAFPGSVLSWTLILTSVFNASISFLILIGLYLALVPNPPIQALWLPVILVPLLLGLLGLGWIVSVIGAYVRDLQQIMGFLATALLFLSPVFYPSSQVPESFRGYYEWNPLAMILEMTRGSLFYGISPPPETLAALIAGGFFFAWIGYSIFSRFEGKLRDVL